jgi:hypothetical protein
MAIMHACIITTHAASSTQQAPPYEDENVGSSEIRSLHAPYGQKMKLNWAPVHVAGLEGGSFT